MQPLDFSNAAELDQKSSLCIKDVVAHCKEYQGADTSKSIVQLITTLALFAGVLTLMYFSLSVSYVLTLLLAVPAGGLLTRIFIFQHDCGHGSFFKTKKVNDMVGRALGILTVTPYDFWRRAHNKHHATSGDLDRRSIGGIDTITLREYQAMSKGRKLYYRLYRNPALLLLIGTPFYVLIGQRFPFTQSMGFYNDFQTIPAASIWKSIMLNNVSLLTVFGFACYFLGVGAVASVYLPVLLITCWIGGWLFYVQHQFEDTYWQKNENWDRQEAALWGSSYYVMPKILQWFTGNIGLHHIHHLHSQIPNYKLQNCMDAKPELGAVNRLTLRESLKSLCLHVWDEDQEKMVNLKSI